MLGARRGEPDMAKADSQYFSAEVSEMVDKALERFLTNDSDRASWARWKNEVARAIKNTESSRKWFYFLRTLALISAIAVPSLVGLNLSGTGGSVVRWLTFALSLVAAVLTSIVTLFRLGDRWLMYRKLREGLLAAGWALVHSPDTDPQGTRRAWNDFIRSTDDTISLYNRTYEATVIQTAQSSSGIDDNKR
jgi:hypothetical protein